ncbi:MAG TPA: WD40 repeat domain-containing protein, partial [Gemmataceae bacterium]|nr:WD40 repeat domain-containing protein [Gemmataceae bacterium]
GFTPDGKGLIINPNWQKEGLLQILDVATGKESMRLQGANYGGGECNLVTCGALMAVSYGGRLDLWEMPAGRLLRQIEVDRNGFVVAIAPDGKTVATGGGGFERGNTNPIKLWDIQSGRLLASFDAHATAIHALAFSADGKRLLSASAEARFGLAGGGTEVVPGAVCVWDAATRKQVARYPNATHGVVFAPGGYSWISQGRDNRLHFFETAGGKQIADIPLPGSTFAFSPDGQVLAATGLGQPISLLGAVEGKEVRRLEGKVGNGWPTLFFAPDGKTLACVTRLNWSVPGGTIRLWDVPSGKEIQPYPVHAHEVACVAQTPDGKTVASGGQDGKLFLWEAATGKRLHRLADHVSGVTALAFSPDGRLLTSGGKHGEVCLWRVADGKELLRLKSGSILSLTFAADGKSIWACSQQGQLQGWDLSGKAMGAFELPARSVHTAALSPVGELLAYSGGVPDEFTGSDTVRICRMTSGKELLTLKLHDRRGREEEPGFEALHCWAVAFSPDGRLLATSESIQTQGLRLILSKHTIRVWELATGKEVLRLADLAVPTKRLAFSPDGRLLAHTHGRMRGWGHGSEDAVFVRDLSAGKSLHQVITDKGEVMCLHSGTELYPIQGHTGQVTCVAFAADGKTLLTGGGDGNVLAWAVERFTPGPGPRPAKVSSEELQALWEQLAGSDAALGYQAIGLLARVPDKTIPFLKERLKPAPAADLKRVGQLILDLEAKSFAVRQKAFSELAGYAEQAEDALRKALPEQRSLEGQRRVQQLLDRLDKIALSPEHLRTLRALTLLERIGTPAARQVLGVLAGGAPTRLTREARASLQRCSR